MHLGEHLDGESLCAIDFAQIAHHHIVGLSVILPSFSFYGALGFDKTSIVLEGASSRAEKQDVSGRGIRNESMPI